MADDGEISVRFTSKEDAALWQSFVKVAQAARKTGEELDSAGQKGLKLDASLMAFAESVKSLDDAALRRLNSEYQRLDQALERGLINQDQYGAHAIRVQSRYQAELRKSREEQERLTSTRAMIGGDGMPTVAATGASNAVDVPRPRDEQGPLVTARPASGKDRIPVLATTGPSVTPLQEYNAELDRLSQKLKANAVTQSAHDAAARAAADEYVRKLQQVQAAQDALAAQAKEAADVAATKEAERQQLALAKAADKTRHELERESAEWKKLADQVRRTDATPIQRLNQEMQRLNDAVHRGTLEQSEWDTLSKRAQDQYQQELAESAAAQRKLSQQSGQAAQESGGFFADMSLAAKAAWAGVGAAIIGTLNEMKQASEQAAQSLQASAASRGTLAQLALDDPEKYKQLTQRAEQLRAGGVTQSLEEANRFVFSMESAGAGAEMATFAEAKKTGLLQNPEQMIAAAAGIRESFGEDQTGSFKDLINRSLVASASSPAKAEELLKGAGKAGVTAKQQGINVDELLAATSILATAKGGADEGGSRLNALLSALATSEPTRDSRGRVKKDSALKESLQGRSLADIAGDESLSAMTPAQLQKALGSREAVEAYGVLRQNRDKLQGLTGQIGAGVAEDKLGKGMAAVSGDRRVMASVEAEKAAGSLEVSRLDRGAAALEARAVVQRGQAVLEAAPQKGLLERASGMSPLGAAVNVYKGDYTDALMGLTGAGTLLDNRTRSAIGGQVADKTRMGLEAIGGDTVFVSLAKMLGGSAEKTTSAADKMDAAADKMAKAAEALEAKAVGGKPRPDFTGPARREAAAAGT